MALLKEEGCAYFRPIHMMYTHFQKAELGELSVDKIGAAAARVY